MRYPHATPTMCNQIAHRAKRISSYLTRLCNTMQFVLLRDVRTRSTDEQMRERERENKFETPSARSDLCHSSRWSQHPTVVYNVRLSTENEMRRKLRRQNSQRCLDGTAHDDSMNNADIFQHHPHTHRERHIANVDAMELLLRHFVALDPFVRRQPDSIPIDTR